MRLREKRKKERKNGSHTRRFYERPKETVEVKRKRFFVEAKKIFGEEIRRAIVIV